MSPEQRDRAGPRLPPTGSRRGWRLLELELPSPLADEFTGSMAGWILGAEHRPARPGTTGIRLFLRSPGRAAEARRAVESALAGLDLDPRACGLRAERIGDERWVERYQAALQPIPLGTRFTILPAGEGAPAAGRQAILLSPGRAFGTGEHATTQLCAEQLERRVRPGSRWIDLGCGTAILSIVARRSGAGEVLALDHDPEAVAVAAEVLAANGLAGQVRLELGSVERAEGGAWSGVVANVHAPFFLDRAQALHGALRAGGVLVASGFCADEADEVAAALERAGLREVERRSSGPWVVCVGRRRDARRGR